jgi:tRNA pseudouridine55 synthase
LTSTQAIGRIRRVFNPQKIGHAGTLDPLATGILPIAMGEATKTIPFIQDALKTYSFTARLGANSATPTTPRGKSLPPAQTDPLRTTSWTFCRTLSATSSRHPPPTPP